MPENVTTQHPKPARGSGVHEETVHFGYQADRRYGISARLDAFGGFVSCERKEAASNAKAQSCKGRKETQEILNYAFFAFFAPLRWKLLFLFRNTCPVCGRAMLSSYLKISY